MLKVKLLKLYRDGEHFQTVRFEKHNKIQGWQPVHFDDTKYLPFALYQSIPDIKKSLIKEGIEWQWADTDTF